MALYSDNAIVRGIFRHTMHGQLVENVWHFRTKNADIPDTEIATTLRDKIWRQLDANFSGDLSCDVITVQEIFPVMRDPYEKVIGEVGASEGPALPVANAIVVAFKTGLGGRRNRGRKYFAGLVDTETEASRIKDTRYAAIQADMQAINDWFQESNTSSNLEYGVLHRRAAGAPVPLSATSFVPITSAITRQTLYTMRSRLPGHGS